MKSFLTLTLTLLTSYTFATDIDLKLAQKKGQELFMKCVLIPPSNKAQISYCDTVKEDYYSLLAVVASPTPMSINTNLSATSWSPWDPCRFDASVFVFNNPASQPYCPST